MTTLVPYPNKRQWVVIWVGAVIAFLALAAEELAVSFAVVVFAGLLIWQLSQNAPEDPDATGVFCRTCGSQIRQGTRFCPECGTAVRR